MKTNQNTSKQHIIQKILIDNDLSIKEFLKFCKVKYGTFHKCTALKEDSNEYLNKLRYDMKKYLQFKRAGLDKALKDLEE